jgi:YggT family protein
VLHLLVNAYSLLVLVAVILSWIQVAADNPVRRVTDALVEPVLRRIRKVLPDLGGLDFSPWVLLIGLQLMGRLL